MKRTLSTLALSLALVGLTACASPSAGSDTSLYEEGLALAVQMDQMAESPEYVSLYSMSDEINSVMSDIGAEDYNSPTAVYQMTGASLGMIDMYLGLAGDVEIPSDLLPIVEKRMGGAIFQMLNGTNGSEIIAAASLLTNDTAFLYPELEEQTAYLYLYDGNYAVGVVFNPGRDGIVTATSTIVQTDGLWDGSSMEEIIASAEEMLGEFGVTISQVEQ